MSNLEAADTQVVPGAGRATMRRERVGRAFSLGDLLMGANAWFIYIALYAPILVLIVFSFNQSKLNAIWTGLTFDWYGVLFNDAAVGKAATNTLIVALISTAVATVLGTMTALALSRYNFFGKTAFEG